MRSNLLDVVGDIFGRRASNKPSGSILPGSDLDDQPRPPAGRHVRRPGPFLERPPPLVVDGSYVHLSGGAADFTLKPEGR
jgi:hypothetical protein